MTYPIAQSYGAAYEILDLQLHPVNVDQVHDYIGRVIDAKEKALVLNLNVHAVNLAGKESWMRDFLNSAQLVFCDGDGVRWGLFLLGHKPPPKITYASWMWQLARYMQTKNYSFYFLGGSPGVAQKAADKISDGVPGIHIAGVHHGYFGKEGAENDEVIKKINESQADVLVVGFGMPIQERWLQANWQKLNVHIFLSGGAVFDYLSGNLQRAPEWMLKLHMEWLFRLCQEPKRLFHRYVVGNPKFIFNVLCHRFKRKKK